MAKEIARQAARGAIAALVRLVRRTAIAARLGQYVLGQYVLAQYVLALYVLAMSRRMMPEMCAGGVPIRVVVPGVCVGTQQLREHEGERGHG